MTPKAAIDVAHFQKLGVTFLPAFLGGAVGVIARYDLPRLRFPSSMTSQMADQALDEFNVELKRRFKGCGYYGHCPQTEIESGDGHIFVLFADDDFYANLSGNRLAECN